MRQFVRRHGVRSFRLSSDNITGIVFAIDHDRQPSHVYIQHSTGMYDAGYFTKSELYRYRGKMTDGILDGRISARKVTTSTTTMSFDVQFAAEVAGSR